MIEIDYKFLGGQVHHHWTTCHSKQNIRIYLNLNIDSRIDMCVELSFGRLMPCDMLPSPKLGPRWALVSKIAELWGLEGHVPNS